MKRLGVVLVTCLLVFLYRSIGRAQWVQTSGTTNYLYAVSFSSALVGTVVGSSGKILRTTNGGGNWANQTSGTGNILFGVSFTDADKGTVVGSNGTVLHTTNGGISWTSQSSGTTNDLYSISFTDINTGTAVGRYGTIVRTTNGGASWASQLSGTTNDLLSVSFASANEGTAVGVAGTILRTTNGGVTWTTQTSGTTNSLRGDCFTEASTGTAVGDLGIILRTTTGGVVAVEDRSEGGLPLGFTLSQNYPNPFNPSTTINYQTSQQCHITLRVYDLLGRGVATLVNGTEEPGNKSVQFDASGMASGTYFYRLQAGSSVDVKKLVLLR